MTEISISFDDLSCGKNTANRGDFMDLHIVLYEEIKAANHRIEDLERKS